MVAYVTLTVDELNRTADEEIVDRLLRSDSVSGFTQVAHNQIGAWRQELIILRRIAAALAHYPRSGSIGIVLEYRIPRREKRIDAAILLSSSVLLLEFKVGADSSNPADIAQTMDYALDLAYYHAESAGKFIVPILCPTAKIGADTVPVSASPAIRDLRVLGIETLVAEVSRSVADELKAGVSLIDPKAWATSQYKPIPGVIDAAVRLFSKHNVEEISQTLAESAAIAATVNFVEDLIGRSRQNRKKVLCLLTGVPGAGKTLLGLQVAHLERLNQSAWLTVFMSGNGPLLKVLRTALTKDYAAQNGVSKSSAKNHAEALVHSVHSYLAESLHRVEPPSEHVVIFDEAQRAWDCSKIQKMANKARAPGEIKNEGAGNAFQKSEPWQIMHVLDRHDDGAVVIALCGNGQEIHDGEAGVAEWLSARDENFSHWEVHCSPIAAELSGAKTAHAGLCITPHLHLDVPLRSHRAFGHAAWVDAVLKGDPKSARAKISTVDFPIFVTRDLETARDWLWKTTAGTRRCGLLASSGGTRLRPYGIEVSADFRKGVDFPLWFTGDKDDLRSSHALEVAATEFECQGLELDRVGLCWSWDLAIKAGQLTPQKFKGTKWNAVKSPRERTYVLNKYRVLLTRAREGMVIWVPNGREQDISRSPTEVDALAEHLQDCGAVLLKNPQKTVDRSKPKKSGDDATGIQTAFTLVL
ncbi:MAG: hypothetical protein JWR22_2289 [Herminiimonas sp.]|nr:hypothetical protein [Herminiimonas sp.]